MDWGLLQPGSRRWGLRNTLLINHEDPWPYYAAVAVDLVLRLAWLSRLAEGRFQSMDMVLTLELVEVRGLNGMGWDGMRWDEMGWDGMCMVFTLEQFENRSRGEGADR